MNKVSGQYNDFSLYRDDNSRIAIGYGLTQVSDTMYEWYEVYFYKRKDGIPTFEMARDAIIEDIDKQTKVAILNGGYEWTVLHGEDAGKTVKVWLSDENQTNYKAKHDTARQYPNLVTWPMKYKISEGEDKTPIYEYFENIEELAQFYLGGVAYIEQCYQNGWQRKDSIDWDAYKPFFPVVTENQ